MAVSLQSLTQAVAARLASGEGTVFKPGQVLEALVLGKSADGLTQLKVGDQLLQALLKDALPIGTVLKLAVTTGGSAPKLTIVSQAPPATANAPAVAPANTVPRSAPIPAGQATAAPPAAPSVVPRPAVSAARILAQTAPGAIPIDARPVAPAAPQASASQAPASAPANPPAPAPPGAAPSPHPPAAQASQPAPVTALAAPPVTIGQTAVTPVPAASPPLPAPPSVMSNPPAQQAPPSSAPAPPAPLPTASPTALSAPPVAANVAPAPAGPAVVPAAPAASGAARVPAPVPAPPSTLPAVPAGAPALTTPAVQQAAATPTTPAASPTPQASTPSAPSPVPANPQPAPTPQPTGSLLVAQAAPRAPLNPAQLPRTAALQAQPAPSPSAPSPAAPAPVQQPATPAAALAQMVPSALARQASPAPLLSALAVVVANPAGLPEPVMRAARQVLAQQTVIAEKLTGEQLQQAVARSGVFLEATLARGLPVPADAKAALLALKAAIGSFLGATPGATVPAEQAPPPVRGAPPRVAGFELPVLPDAPRDVAHLLHTHTDGALARIKLLQLASLPDVDGVRPAPPELRVELPFLLGSELVMAQLQVMQDGGRRQANGKRGWTMRFALNSAATGEVGAEIGLLGSDVNVALWAADPDMAAELARTLPELEQALAGLGLTPGAIRCRGGVPQSAAQPSGQFMDSLS